MRHSVWSGQRPFAFARMSVSIPKNANTPNCAVASQTRPFSHRSPSCDGDLRALPHENARAMERRPHSESFVHLKFDEDGENSCWRNTSRPVWSVPCYLRAPRLRNRRRFRWRASKVVGLNVYNDENENVGSINELLMDKSGNIKAAVLSVGGFLGMGAHYVAVPFDKIKFSNEPVSYAATSTKPNTDARPQSTFNANKDELKSMPEFQFSND
jgi:sporulation protein YlmC with PRC-barrel domain